MAYLEIAKLNWNFLIMSFKMMITFWYPNIHYVILMATKCPAILFALYSDISLDHHSYKQSSL